MSGLRMVLLMSLSLLGGSGCLSVDNLGVDEPASVPCHDEGMIADLTGLTIEARSGVCDGARVCVAGRCIEEPACAPDVLGPCKVSLSPLPGKRTNLAAVGDRFYWIESGTGDEGDAPIPGLIGMDAGDWEREEEGGYFDLYHEPTESVLHPRRLERHDEWFVVPAGYAAQRPMFFGPHGLGFFPPEERILTIAPDQYVYRARRVGTDGETMLVQQKLFPDSDEGPTLHEYPDVHPVGRGYERHGRFAVQEARADGRQDGPIVVIDRVTHTVQRYEGGPVRLLGFRDEGLIALAHDELVAAVPGEEGVLDWQVLRPLGVGSAEITLLDEHVIWMHDEGILVGALRGGPARVIADLSLLFDRDDDTYVAGSMTVGQSWIAYAEPRLQYTHRDVVHFVPYTLPAIRD